MKLRSSGIAAGMLSAILLASQGYAAPSCGTTGFELLSDPSTPQGLMMVGNAGYNGFITAGTLYPGIWSLRFDDSTWPTATNPRRNYLKGRYVYNGVDRFNATFSMSEVAVDLTGNSLSYDGVVQVILTIVDADSDGNLDNSEFDGAQTLSATVDMNCALPGNVCGGPGDANGGVNLSTVTAPLTGSVNSTPCVTAVAAEPWGTVKHLYRTP